MFQRVRASAAIWGVGMVKRLLVAAAVLVAGTISQPPASAHRDGCHRWHSCPSDSGSYTCGDLGYYSECGGSTYTPPPPPPRDTTPPKRASIRGTRLRGNVMRFVLSAEGGATIFFWDGGTLLESMAASGGRQVVELSLEEGRHTITVVVKDSSGNKSRAVERSLVVDTKAPRPAQLAVVPGATSNPETTLKVIGEPDTTYQLYIYGPQSNETSARIPLSGDTKIKLTLQNGSYRAVVTLTDDRGNRSQKTVETFKVSMPAPEAPSAEVTSSEPGAVTLAINGTPGSKIVVTLLSEMVGSVSLSPTGEGELSVALPAGEDADLQLQASDFQGQASSFVTLSVAVPKEPSDTASTVMGGLVVLGGLGFGFRKRLARAIRKARVS